MDSIKRRKNNFLKIIIIFVVGLVFRVGISYLLGINVFVDFLNVVSLGYYGFMSCFSVMLDGVFVKIPSDGSLSVKTNDIVSNVLCDRNHSSEGQIRQNTYTRRPPAGVRGLYENGANTRNLSIDPNINKGVRIKAKIY